MATPKPLKVYDMGRNGYVSVEAARELGLASGHYQARVFLVAATKKAAVELAHTCRMHSTADTRTARGNDVDVLAAAGLFTRPAVYALPKFTSGPLLELLTDGGHRIAGHLRYDQRTAARIFEPAADDTPES